MKKKSESSKPRVEMDVLEKYREDSFSLGTNRGVGRPGKVGSEKSSDASVIPMKSYCREPFSGKE